MAVLVPITGWAVYIMGLIQKEYDALALSESDWSAFVAAIPFNFFSIITVVLVPVAALAAVDLGAMKRAEERARGGELYWPHSKPLRLPADVSDTDSSASLVWVPLLVLFRDALRPSRAPRVSARTSAGECLPHRAHRGILPGRRVASRVDVALALTRSSVTCSIFIPTASKR